MGKLYADDEFLCDVEPDADNEQWKSDGNCELCRRRKYCGRDCKAAKERAERILGEAFSRTLKRKHYQTRKGYEIDGKA